MSLRAACLVVLGLAWLAACDDPNLMLGNDDPADGMGAEHDPGDGDGDNSETGGDGDGDNSGEIGDGDGDHSEEMGDGDGDNSGEMGDGDGDSQDPPCSGDIDCAGEDEEFCDTLEGHCVECVEMAHCTEFGEIDCVDGECIECRIDSDCASLLTCRDGSCEL